MHIAVDVVEFEQAA